MDEKPTEFDIETIEKMNQKAIKSQFFVPDNVYIELGLFKDYSIGAIYTDLIFIKEDEEQFSKAQQHIIQKLRDYQIRKFDSTFDFFKDIGYSDKDIDQLLQNEAIHDQLFILSPNTKFIQMLIRHTLRNQNNSRPAEKYVKKKIDDNHYIMEAQDVTFRINTYPLSLSSGLLQRTAEEFGEAFGVNIIFMNKDPSTFDEQDWDEWMKQTDCYYLDSLGRFTKSSIIMNKQENMEMVGVYVFARKRFEREVFHIVSQMDFDQQVQMVTAYQGILCDFEWIQNNDLRLTEEADNVPMMDDDQTMSASDATKT